MKRPVIFKFRLYVADKSLNANEAVANLSTFCRLHLPDWHEIEIVDVFKDPQRALAEGIFMTPALVKFEPSPIQKIIGTLSQTDIVLQTLCLESPAA